MRYTVVDPAALDKERMRSLLFLNQMRKQFYEESTFVIAMSAWLLILKSVPRMKMQHVIVTAKRSMKILKNVCLMKMMVLRSPCCMN